MGHFAAGSSSRSRYERSSARRGTTLLVLPLDVRIISHRSHHLASPTQQGAPSCTVSPLYDLARRGVAAPTQQGHPRAQPSMLCDLVRQGAETAQQRSRTHRRRRALPLRMFVVRTKAHTSPGGLMRGGGDSTHSIPYRFVSTCPRPRGYIPGACMLDVWKPVPGSFRELPAGVLFGSV